MKRAELEAVSFRGFRNLAEGTYRPGPHVNVLDGDNGAGKSSVLEAIALLASLRSFRGAATEDMVSLGARAARLEASVRAEPLPRALTMELDLDAPRRLRLDGKRPAHLAQWRSVLPLVLFHPGQLELSSGGAGGRRAFLDEALEQIDGAYGHAHATYTKALRSRNRLLKLDRAPDHALDAYDVILAESGSVLAKARERFVRELEPLVEGAFARITDDALGMRMAYAPRVAPDREALLAALRASRAKDRERKFTAEGPHGDDVAFRVKEQTTARHHASQGQHRALVLALKVAELELVARALGETPVLLLDDVTSELDRTRNRRFFELLAARGGQVFLTTTHRDYIELEGERRNVRVEGGVLHG